MPDDRASLEATAVRVFTHRQAIGIDLFGSPAALRALHDGDFAVGDYFIDRVVQAPDLFAAFAAVNSHGRSTSSLAPSIGRIANQSNSI